MRAVQGDSRFEGKVLGWIGEAQMSLRVCPGSPLCLFEMEMQCPCVTTSVGEGKRKVYGGGQT